MRSGRRKERSGWLREQEPNWHKHHNHLCDHNHFELKPSEFCSNIFIFLFCTRLKWSEGEKNRVEEENDGRDEMSQEERRGGWAWWTALFNHFLLSSPLLLSLLFRAPSSTSFSPVVIFSSIIIGHQHHHPIHHHLVSDALESVDHEPLTRIESKHEKWRWDETVLHSSLNR